MVEDWNYDDEDDAVAYLEWDSGRDIKQEGTNMDRLQQLNEAIEGMHTMGGSTLWLDGVDREPGYIVGYGGQGLKVTELPAIAYLLSVAMRWEHKGFDGMGFWKDNGTIYIDPVRHFTDLDMAVFVGRANNEIGIYDMANREVILLK